MLLTRSLNARPSVGRPSAFRAAPTPVRSSFAVRAKAAEVEVKSKKEEKKEEEEEFDDGVLPSTAQVESLLNALCNETEIAELNLKMSSFSLKVKRSMSGHMVAAVAPAPAPVVAAAPAPVVSAPAAEPSVEDTVDESLVTVTAPKVGIFRRGKYAAGKRVGKGNCVNEGDKVKKGQPIGYIEQLGTFIAVGSSIAGEVVKFHVEDGKPVEYLQVVADVAPYFGGHIIGDSKHA